MSIQIDNASILVLDGKNESSNVVDVRNSECLLVQLDLVGRVGEVAGISLSPSFSGSWWIPISRNFTMLVIPVGMGKNGILSIKRTRWRETDIYVISHTKNRFHFITIENSTDIQKGSSAPITVFGSYSNCILWSSNANNMGPIFITNLTRVGSNRYDCLLGWSILNFETLLSSIGSIGT